jgi:hypothetical protein
MVPTYLVAAEECARQVMSVQEDNSLIRLRLPRPLHPD